MRKAIWPVLAIAGLAAATATASAGTGPEKARITRHRHILVPVPVPTTVPGTVDLAVPEILHPTPVTPSITPMLVPDAAFGDGRAYPFGMVLIAPPVVTRTVMVVAVIEAPTPDPTWPLIALLGGAAAALGFVALRRRAAGSLAHPIGTL